MKVTVGRGLCAVALGTLLGILGVANLHAQKEADVAAKKLATKTPPAATSPLPPGTHELTATDLEAYLDGMMPAQLEREDIAGAVITVVKDGQVLFMKGYGFSDEAKRTPVTPDNTLFRPGSISKLFTWTSVMQLVEQGKLDLDKDVNEYIDFKIPPAFGKPITLRNIMTHTAGFQETIHDLFVADAAHLYPIDRYLKDRLPTRIFPPGVVPAYSNYATTLAGYIVQRVSGKPFDQYVQDNIYTPLNMKKTTFVQPLPAELQPLMSNGYQRASQDAKPYEFVEAYPAGSVATTGRDMCNFMIAHLQNGKFENTQILKPETAMQMHSRTYGPDDRLNAMALGFYEETRNGHRIIGHGGDTEFFHSDLHLILDQNVGFFVSYNSAGRGEVSPRTILFEGFLDRYYPYTPPAGEKIADAKADAQLVSGLYKNSRRFDDNFLSVLTFASETKVITNADGTISIEDSKGPNGVPKKFEEISPLLFREVHGQDHLAFKKDADGNLQFQMDFPVFIFQRVGAWQSKPLQMTFLIFGLGISLLTVILWPVAALVRKHYGKKLEFAPGEARSRRFVRLLCILNVLVFVGWLLVISRFSSITGLNNLKPLLVVVELLGLLAGVGSIVAILHAFRTLSIPGRWIWTKLHELAIALACVSLLLFLYTWSMINFNFRY